MLPLLPPSTLYTVNGISGDGQTIAGKAHDQVVIWRNGHIQPLPLSSNVGDEFAIRSDGRMIGVESAEGAMLWEEGVGSRRLEDVVASLGFDAGGFKFASIRGISADGRTLTGMGYTSQREVVSYLLTIVPTPGACLAFLTTPVMIARRRTRA